LHHLCSEDELRVRLNASILLMAIEIGDILPTPQIHLKSSTIQAKWWTLPVQIQFIPVSLTKIYSLLTNNYYLQVQNVQLKKYRRSCTVKFIHFTCHWNITVNTCTCMHNLDHDYVPKIRHFNHDIIGDFPLNKRQIWRPCFKMLATMLLQCLPLLEVMVR
jgi:hypothetical protein